MFESNVKPDDKKDGVAVEESKENTETATPIILLSNKSTVTLFECDFTRPEQTEEEKQYAQRMMELAQF